MKILAVISRGLRILCVFVVPVFISGCDNPESPKDSGNPNLGHQEVGDAIYCDINNPIVQAWGCHTGIYYRYIGGNPDDRNNHLVIHAPGRPNHSHPSCVATFPEFLIGRDYYGPYTANFIGHLAYEKREAILKVAKDIAAAEIPYTFLLGALDVLVPKWDDHRWDGTVTDIKEIRCDGLVEYAYEKAGIPVWGMGSAVEDASMCEPVAREDYDAGTGNLSWHNAQLTPDAQRGFGEEPPGYTRMQRSRPEDPSAVTDLIALTHDEEGSPITPSESHIEIAWKDATDGQSGIWGYYVRVDQEPNSIPTYLDPAVVRVDPSNPAEEDHGPLPMRLGYLPTWRSPYLSPGEYYVHIRSVDNAGNWGGTDPDQCTAHLGPLMILEGDGGWTVGSYEPVFSWDWGAWSNSERKLDLAFCQRPSDMHTYPLATIRIEGFSEDQVGMPLIPSSCQIAIDGSCAMFTDLYWHQGGAGPPCYVTITDFQRPDPYYGVVSGVVSGHLRNVFQSSVPVPVAASFDSVTVTWDGT